MLESHSEIAEGFVIALAFLVFLGYQFWAFFVAGQGCLTTTKESYGINGKGRLARVVFTSNVCEVSKHAILGVQNLRNGMMGVSFQASIAAIFFNLLLEVLLDSTKLQFVGTFAKHDPLLYDKSTVPSSSSTAPVIGVVSVRAVVLFNLCLVLTAMMVFIVCVRLYIHMGYFYGAASNKLQSWVKVQDAVELTLHTQMMYTIGQRLMYFFPVTIIWLLGPTAMLCASVVITACLAYVDRWDPKWKNNYQAVLDSIAASSANARLIRRRSSLRKW